MAKRTNRKLTAAVPDIHLGHHDQDALDWCFRRLNKERPGHIVFLGDIFDFDSVSRFLKKPQFGHMFNQEVELGCKFIERVKALVYRLDCKVTIQAGNHEARLSKYLWRNAPELSEVPNFTIPRLMNIPKDWQYIQYNTGGIRIGEVIYFHGRKFNSNVCVSNIRKFCCSVVQGHSHRSSAHYLRRPDGKLIGAIEAGCLCSLNPTYASHVDWSHAMGWVEDDVPTLELK